MIKIAVNDQVAMTALFERQIRACGSAMNMHNLNLKRMCPDADDVYEDDHVELAWRVFVATVTLARTHDVAAVDAGHLPMDAKTKVIMGSVGAGPLGLTPAPAPRYTIVDEREQPMVGMPVTAEPYTPMAAAPTREEMVAKLVEVKDKFGSQEAKQIVSLIGHRDKRYDAFSKLADIPSDRIADVIKACDERLAPPVPAATVTPSRDAASAELGKAVNVALMMARSLSDEKNVIGSTDLAGNVFCRYCNTGKAPDDLIRWKHFPGCIVNTALQTIENYTQDDIY